MPESRDTSSAARIAGIPVEIDKKAERGVVRLVHTSFGRRDWRFLWLRRVRVRRDMGRFKWPTI